MLFTQDEAPSYTTLKSTQNKNGKKLNFAQEQSMKAQGRIRSTAVLFL
jgi:hypothetical protein